MNLKSLINSISLQKGKLVLSCFVIFFSANITAQTTFPDITKSKEGKLSLTADNKGNQITDFSFAGYKTSSVAIPNVAIKVFVPNIEGDATKTIQSAIDYVAKLKGNASQAAGRVIGALKSDAEIEDNRLEFY